MHRPKAVEFGDGPGQREPDAAGLLEREGTPLGDLLCERSTNDILADDQPVRADLLEREGAARRRIGRLVGNRRPSNDVGPDFELAAAFRIEQQQADATGRRLVSGPKQPAIGRRMLETFLQPVVADQKRPPVAADEPAGLPDGDRPAPDEPLREQFRDGVAGGARGDALTLELAPQPQRLVIVGEPGGDEQAPEFGGRGDRHRPNSSKATIAAARIVALLPESRQRPRESMARGNGSGL